MIYLGTTASTRYGAIALKQRVSDDYTPTGATDAHHGGGGPSTARGSSSTALRAAPTTTWRSGRSGRSRTQTSTDTLRSRQPAADRRSRLQRRHDRGHAGPERCTRATCGSTSTSASRASFGRVSELKDKDNNLWKYLDSDVATIYLPKQNYDNLTQFGGLSTGNEDAKRGGHR